LTEARAIRFAFRSELSPPLSQRLERADRSRRDALLVFAVALLARIAVVAWAHARFPPVADGHYYDVFARRLAAGSGYTWLWPDGAVTFAAHYPVGYPAVLGLAYAVFGPSGAVAMTANAFFGAAGAVAAHSLAVESAASRAKSLCAGLVVALHPALVPYTAAVMTEGVTASLWLVAAALAARARVASSAAPWIVTAGAAMGLATLVRPQSLALAPVFGLVSLRSGAGARARLVRAAAVTATALVFVAPWTARNCARMHRCALVSVNGGWNLLVGVQSTSGAWEPVETPAECATVWDEATKDVCFQRAAQREIAAAPGRWLSRVPAKLAVTFDYFGAAPWYLHASNAAEFGEEAKLRLGAFETIASRLFLLAALVSCGRREGPRELPRKALALTGAMAAVTLHAWLGYAAIAGCVALLGRRATASAAAVVPLTAAVIAVTAAIHAVFFGAGRYGLVVVPFVAALPFAERHAKGSPSTACERVPPL
jgi:4-amino-4-deoxy-L-arabinose transferase-like glycosyltransferase